MTRLQTMRRIVLPQAMRVIIPPTGNETISMLKTTLARQRDRLHRAAVLGAADLRGQLPADPAAARGEHLVPDRDHACSRSASTTSSGTSAAARRASCPTRRSSGCGATCSRSGTRPSTCAGARSGERPMNDADGPRRGRPQALRAPRGAQGHLAGGPAAARCCACSARRARASRRSCAASTTSRRSTPGACGSTASSSATAQRGDKLYELRDTRGRAASAREIGMVFQRFNLFPHMTALENVIEAPVRSTGSAAGEARERGARAARAGRASPTRSTPTRRSCRAASSSASRSPARWRWSPS